MRNSNWLAAFAVLAVFALSSQKISAHTLTPAVGSAAVSARPAPDDHIHVTSRSKPAWDEPVASTCTQTGVNTANKPIEQCCPPPGGEGACVQLDAAGPLQSNADGTPNPEVCYAIWEGDSTVSFDCYYEKDPS